MLITKWSKKAQERVVKMKKLLATIMIMSMLLTTGIVAFAQKDNDVSVQLDVDEEITEADIEYSDYLMQLGEALSKRRATTVLSNFKNLQQTDPNWKNEIMQTRGETIGNSGCCLTSFTMIQRYYGGTDSPKEVNQKMGDYACLFYYDVAAARYGYTCYAASSTALSNYVNYIKGAIGSGQPVLVGMNNPSGGYHYVAAYGFDGNEIIISDPSSKKYQYLSQYTNLGYTMYKMHTYFK